MLLLDDEQLHADGSRGGCLAPPVAAAGPAPAGEEETMQCTRTV